MRTLKEYFKVIEEDEGRLAGKLAVLESHVNDLKKENQVLTKQKKQLQQELCGSKQEEAALKNKIIDLEGNLYILGDIRDQRDKLLRENIDLKQSLSGTYDEIKRELKTTREL